MAGRNMVGISAASERMVMRPRALCLDRSVLAGRPWAVDRENKWRPQRPPSPDSATRTLG